MRTNRPSILSLPLIAMLTGIGTAQSAAVTILDAPCSAGSGAPMMGTRGQPRLGTTFTVTYSGPNYQVGLLSQDYVQPHIVIGFRSLGAVTIPQGLFPLQPPNCRLRPSHDAVIPMAPNPFIPHGPFASSQELSIPNLPALVGVSFFAQWLAVRRQCATGCSIDWIATSETALCTIGT